MRLKGGALQEKEDKHMFCKNCGAKLDDDSRFCTNCGATAEGGAVKVNPSGQRPASAGPKPNPSKKTNFVPFIIIGVVVVIVIAAVIIISAIKSAAEKSTDDYNDFYTKDEFNQMMDDLENEENNRTKGIGEHMAEDFMDSVNNSGEKDESDKELDEKLKNSASPWFKDPEDLYPEESGDKSGKEK